MIFLMTGLMAQNKDTNIVAAKCVKVKQQKQRE